MKKVVSKVEEKSVEKVGEVELKVTKRGRPIDPNSKRQQRLATAPGKKTGRPIDPNSKRQQRLVELEAKRESGELRRGRPVDPNSARQQRLREAALKLMKEMQS